MTIEQFNSKDYLPKGYYPWPDLINSHVEQMGIEMNEWIDTDYTIWPQKVRDKYKKMILHDVTARMIPFMEPDNIRPLNRFMIYLTSFDDQHELHSVAELEELRKRTLEIMAGNTPTPKEKGWFSQLALIRDEYKASISQEWIERFVEELSNFIQYGMEEETPYKIARRIPSLAHYITFREYSIGMRPFLIASELELDYILPQHIIKHPVLRRLLALSARIVAWQNDIHSLRKEFGKDTETLNIVLVLQQEHNLSLQEAIAETMRIHDQDVAEFVSLHENLPDFGEYHKMVDKYVLCLGIQVQGVNTYYLTETLRYLPLGAGFAWPNIESTKET